MLFANELGRLELQRALGSINVLNELRVMSITFALYGVSEMWIPLLNLQAH